MIANFEYQAKPIYHDQGGGLPRRSAELGLAARDHAAQVAFGVKWLDYDNDGWLDLAFTNGHVQDNIDRTNPGHSVSPADAAVPQRLPGGASPK